MTVVSRIIPLGADAVRAPTLFHLGLLWAYMVFPDDPQMRERAIKLAATEHAAALMEAGQLSPEKIKNLVRVAIDVISPSDLEDQSIQRRQRGLSAGIILYNSCLRARRGDRAVLKRAKDEIDGVLGKQKSGTSRHVDKVVWKDFQPVAPFWAAFSWFEENMTVDELPCNRIDLPQFLKMSEEFRELGENTKPFKSPSILPPGECYRLSADVIALLPAGTLTPA
jgi:hypothetical protein